MENCKDCIWFFPDKECSEVGSCARFGDDELIEKNSIVFDSNQKTKLPLCDVGEDFGCIHFEESI